MKVKVFRDGETVYVQITGTDAKALTDRLSASLTDGVSEVVSGLESLSADNDPVSVPITAKEIVPEKKKEEKPVTTKSDDYDPFGSDDAPDKPESLRSEMNEPEDSNTSESPVKSIKEESAASDSYDPFM